MQFLGKRVCMCANRHIDCLKWHQSYLKMKTFTKSILAAASAVFLALSAQAVTIDLSIAQSIGYIDPGTPSSPAAEVGYINKLLSMTVGTSDTSGTPDFYRTSGPAGLQAVTMLATKDESNNPDRTDVPVGIFDYAIGKYGNNSYVWYIGGLGSLNAFTIPASAPSGGLSHLSRYDSTDSDIPTPPAVPDSGSTIALLGLAVAALAFAKRKF